MRKLLANPKQLRVSSGGTQTKSYIWIEDAVAATLIAWKCSGRGFEVFNVGSVDAITVERAAEIVVEEGGLSNVEIIYTGGVEGRGWVGDVRGMHLDVGKLVSLGWSPRYKSEESVRLAARHYWELARRGLIVPLTETAT